MMDTTETTIPARRTVARTAAGVITAAAMVATLLTPMTAQAQRRGEPQLRVSYPTDGALTCDQLGAEINAVAEIAGIAAQNVQNAESQGAMANVATSVAINGALYSGALGAVPGLGAFASLAGGMARRNAEARARAEAERIRIAEQRYSLLTGIYQGRQCGLPAAPAPEAVVAVAAETPAVETEVAAVAEAAPAAPELIQTSAPAADD